MVFYSLVLIQSERTCDHDILEVHVATIFRVQIICNNQPIQATKELTKGRERAIAQADILWSG